MSESSRRLFTRGSWSETSRVADILRKETIGGILVLLAAIVALILANSPASNAYHRLMAASIGPDELHLDLSIGAWAADGLLALFFFVVGLELKREFVAGDLREPARAALPIAAAVGGMVVPALIFVGFNVGSDDAALSGWAVPTATDIAFAVAVLAVVGTHLPSALRTFLLTLAVVDDLLAIIVIAVFYSSQLNFAALGLALIPLSLFAIAVQRRIRSWWLLVPLAVVTWALVHASGIHATVAGVLLGFTVPVIRSDAAGGPDAGPGLAEHFEHRLRPLSAGVAVPLFAFCAAGVTVGGLAGLQRALHDHVTLGVMVGLVVGKAVGVFGTTFALAKFTRASLDDGLRWPDVGGVAILAGIGFTVSLLISELAFDDAARVEHAKVGVLLGSVTAALIAAVVLRLRNRSYSRLADVEEVDDDHDGIPDVYRDRA
ncbi:Na+/H+ antiporter NhaA [Gordonia sp. TBRC 11910]|uniref:Na(+)/H(+) antiporter NhaA n=1 Tax=Gordonia asplenii TaxID=2725283 RepID=A0A848L2X2_9ACTN|nr:Na+/H+ antiporter NhaA [Gordonia asplenii]NMO05079.1 Na+/H+ antiporter NhaA [Gordonia asplenii]